MEIFAIKELFRQKKILCERFTNNLDNYLNVDRCSENLCTQKDKDK